jgi:hypothetical protein
MMSIWVVEAALLVAHSMDDYKDGGPQGPFRVLMSNGQGRWGTFTRQYLRRVNAEFAADGDFAYVRVAGGRV